jgi:hypothetical protein
MEPSLNSSLALLTAEMSKGTYRLLTLQIFNTALFFAGSVIYIAYRPVYARATRTSDCQIKISLSRGDIIVECYTGYWYFPSVLPAKYSDSTAEKAMTASSQLVRNLAIQRLVTADSTVD